MTKNSNMDTERRRIVLEALVTPHTLYELSDKLRVAPYTLRRVIRDLEAAQLVRQTPWLEGRKKSWVSVVEESPYGSITIMLPGREPRPVGDFIGATGDVIPVVPGENSGQWVYPPGVSAGNHEDLSDIDGALAQCYLNSLYNTKHDHTLDNTKSGSVSPATCRAILRKKLEWIDQLRIIVEQLVLADIWTEATVENARKFGVVDEEKALRIAREFEHRHPEVN